MPTTITPYKQLEALIRKGDLAALEARWKFGRRLLQERDGAKRLPDGRLEELAKALASSRAELKNRMQFAEEHRTTAEVEVAFKEYGSWSAICAHGMGERRSQAYDARMAAEKADAAAHLQDPVSVLVGRIGGVITEWRDLLLELQKCVDPGDRLLEVYVRDTLMVAEQQFARYQRRWAAAGAPRELGLLKYISDRNRPEMVGVA